MAHHAKAWGCATAPLLWGAGNFHLSKYFGGVKELL